MCFSFRWASSECKAGRWEGMAVNVWKDSFYQGNDCWWMNRLSVRRWPRLTSNSGILWPVFHASTASRGGSTLAFPNKSPVTVLCLNHRLPLLWPRLPRFGCGSDVPTWGPGEGVCGWSHSYLRGTASARSPALASWGESPKGFAPKPGDLGNTG